MSLALRGLALTAIRDFTLSAVIQPIQTSDLILVIIARFTCMIHGGCNAIPANWVRRSYGDCLISLKRAQRSELFCRLTAMYSMILETYWLCKFQLIFNIISTNKKSIQYCCKTHRQQMFVSILCDSYNPNGFCSRKSHFWCALQAYCARV